MRTRARAWPFARACRSAAIDSNQRLLMWAYADGLTPRASGEWVGSLRRRFEE